MEGVLSDGTPFSRSTEHLIKIVDEHTALTGSASVVKGQNANRVEFLAEVTQDSDETFTYYAEVWGTKEGKAEPAAWVGGLANIEQIAGKNFVRMEFDLNWANNAQISGPFTLKNAYMRSASHEVVVTKIDTIKVKMAQDVHTHVSSHLAFLSKRGPTQPTEEMYFGVRPSHLPYNASAGAGSLILVHGYCAAVNPWEFSASSFSNGHFFLNPNANIPNEAFAQSILAYADANQLSGWSGIGHSQGGMVLTHIQNFYWSGMDTTSGGRTVQSVGTPYLGSSAAGSAANLGKLFGIACGSNFDLTTDGAELWLAGISSKIRSRVNYYTTTYKLNTFFGDSCNVAINLILQWPNDGTTELKSAQLPGGVNCGNKEKWCHVTDMNYPAQYTDAARNAEMNQKAAR